MALTKIDDRGLKTPIDLLDNEKIRFGTGNDLNIWHNGTNSFIQNDEGSLYIGGNTGAANTYIRSNDGEINIACIKNGATELYHDNSKKLHTNSGGVEITGHCYFPDNNGSHYGAGEDLRIYHDGSNSWIKDTGTGSLVIASNELQILNAAGNEDQAHFHENGAVELYYDNSKKFETTSAGTQTTGLASVDYTVTQTTGNYAALNLETLSSGTSDDDFATGIDFRADGTNSARMFATKDGKWGVLTNDLGSYAIRSISDGAVELYYDNSKKFETASHGVTVTGNLRLPDNTSGNASIQFGDSQDFFMNHNGTNSYIINNTGDLYIRDLDGDIHIQGKDAEESIIAKADGGVELYYNNSKRLETTANGVTLEHNLLLDNATNAGRDITWDPANDQLQFKDDAKASFGSHSDLQIAHDGSDSNIKNTGTGHLYLYANSSDKGIVIKSNSDVELYYDNSLKLETTSSGITVTGSVTTNDINMSNLNSLPNEVDGTKGSWTMQEGANDLFLINRSNGKKYKFNLTEVS